MLTNATVKAARVRACAYKLWDGAGLALHISTGGTKAWRLRCRAGGKESVKTIGRWPDMTLEMARERAELVRQARAGDDAGDRFETAAREWHAAEAPGWSAAHALDVLTSLERFAFPAIGAMRLGNVEPVHVLQLCRAIEADGRTETARRVRQRISKVFRRAIAEARAASDPAAPIIDALAIRPLTRQHPALVDAAECRALLAAADLVDAATITKLASRFLALTAVRLAGVRGATWDEIEDLDGAAPLWRIPARRMKLTRAKKASAEHDHLVPLAPAAVAVLRAVRADLHSCDADSRIFPIGERAIGDLYVRTPFAGRHVPHGWRASFSTILNEALPGERDAIDRALAHTPKDKVEAAYNRAAQLERRRRLFEAWATVLLARL